MNIDKNCNLCNILYPINKYTKDKCSRCFKMLEPDLYNLFMLFIIAKKYFNNKVKDCEGNFFKHRVIVHDYKLHKKDLKTRQYNNSKLVI